MKDSYLEPNLNPINEARRYVENAHAVLRENGKLDAISNHYKDKKYVRAAGHYLWHSVLIMLEAVFQLKNQNRQHPQFNSYRKAIQERDRKLLTLVNDAYETLHIFMGYDGVRSKGMCDAGFQLANDIIERCEKLIDH